MITRAVYIARETAVSERVSEAIEQAIRATVFFLDSKAKAPYARRVVLRKVSTFFGELQSSFLALQDYCLPGSSLFALVPYPRR